MGIDVSVVVPVYNPGAYLDPCVDSLLGQTLSPERLELIFVDDGSTDDTPARLDALATAHPHVRVIHRENSGWSGAPRNDGIEAARGTMIHFVDQDDFLGVEALQRMYAMAAKNHSDIVIGKVISNGRRVPHHLFKRDRPRTSIAKLPLEDSLTPHKMFRRSMLLEHDIRFPHTHRLEDQPFLLRSYFATDRVSILASYPCYHFSRRDDLGNLSFTRLEPKQYYDNLRAIIDLVEQGVEPGKTRNRIVRRFYRSEVIGRLSEPGLLEIDQEEQAERLVYARKVALETFPTLPSRRPCDPWFASGPGCWRPATSTGSSRWPGTSSTPSPGPTSSPQSGTTTGWCWASGRGCAARTGDRCACCGSATSCTSTRSRWAGSTTWTRFGSAR